MSLNEYKEHVHCTQSFIESDTVKSTTVWLPPKKDLQNIEYKFLYSSSARAVFSYSNWMNVVLNSSVT